MPRLGVLGWPVAHSRSPAMHNAALAELGLQSWHYQALPVPPSLFAQTARALSGSGFRGANVTIPHKLAALAIAEEASETALSIGAANTLTFSDSGTIAADNTDAPGLIAALDCALGRMRVLVLGAGGSARAAAWALREAGAGEVSVWNRTRERARSLAADLGVRFAEQTEAADLLINCTAVGLRSEPSEAAALALLELDDGKLGEYAYVADLAYREGQTELLAAAARHGARTLDGLEVLIAQGALSLELWTGRTAPVEVMRAAVRNHGSERGGEPSEP